MRSSTQLPDSKELQDIIAYEAQREIPPENTDAHFPKFEVFIRLLDELKLDASLLRDDFSAEDWIGGDCQKRAAALVEDLVDKMIHASNKDLLPLFDAIYDYLSEEDGLKKADVIFVFGAKTPLRAEAAVKLYEGGWSQRIVFSGHGPFTGRTEITEAEMYRDLAVKAGVPLADILLEAKSITIPDNVRSSLNLFDEIGFKPKSIILVNSPYAQRRGWSLFRKYLPESVGLIRRNCGTGEKFSRRGWFTNPEGIKVVANEFIKMKIAVTLNTA